MTYAAGVRPDGSVYGEAQGMVAGKGGERATFKALGVGKILDGGGVPATRAFYWIEANHAGHEKRFAREVFRQYYSGQLDTSDPDSVAALVGSLGLEAAKVRAGVEDAKIKDHTRTISEAAVQRGIFGSPFF